MISACFPLRQQLLLSYAGLLLSNESIVDIAMETFKVDNGARDERGLRALPLSYSFRSTCVEEQDYIARLHTDNDLPVSFHQLLAWIDRETDVR
jgi:hypothetical protein